jgi:hypothetical protein
MTNLVLEVRGPFASDGQQEALLANERRHRLRIDDPPICLLGVVGLIGTGEEVDRRDTLGGEIDSKHANPEEKGRHHYCNHVRVS